jgi:hypothetical protein
MCSTTTPHCCMAAPVASTSAAHDTNEQTDSTLSLRWPLLLAMVLLSKCLLPQKATLAFVACHDVTFKVPSAGMTSKLQNVA